MTGNPERCIVIAAPAIQSKLICAGPKNDLQPTTTGIYERERRLEAVQKNFLLSLRRERKATGARTVNGNDERPATLT